MAWQTAEIMVILHLLSLSKNSLGEFFVELCFAQLTDFDLSLREQTYENWSKTNFRTGSSLLS